MLEFASEGFRGMTRSILSSLEGPFFKIFCWGEWHCKWHYMSSIVCEEDASQKHKI